MVAMTKQERRAIERLVKVFGAEALVRLTRAPEITSRERLKLRVAAEERIEFCSACPLHASKGGDTETPLAPFWSPWRLPRAGRVAVVCDAPTMQEHHAQELGYGPLWGTIRAELRTNGIDPDHITYLTTVACTPLSHDRRGTRRTPPEPAHAEICTGNLMQALVAADVDYILLLGSYALRAWRRDLALDRVAGNWYLWRNQWMVFPAEHPSVIMTRSKSITANQWQAHITAFCQGVHGRVELEVLSGGCAKNECRDPMYAWDDDGVPWCRDHWKPGKATRDSRTVKLKDTTQQELL